MDEKRLRFVSRLGCLASIIGPLVAWVLYPRVNWLFACAILAIVVIVLNERFRKDQTPQALADWAERLLDGSYGSYDVDDFEHLRFRNPQLRTLHRRTMEVGGFPEEWINLDEERKNQIRQVIRELREISEPEQVNER